MYNLKKQKTNIKRRKPKAQLESRSLVFCVTVHIVRGTTQLRS
jgi:hypothetical protein